MAKQTKKKPLKPKAKSKPRAKYETKMPTNEALQKAAEKSCGIKSYTARLLKVDRGTIYNWMKINEEFAKMMKDARSVLVDQAEEGLLTRVKEGETKACIYVTATLGKNRGYTQVFETRDKSKIDDQLNDMTDDELLQEINKINDKLKDVV